MVIALQIDYKGTWLSTDELVQQEVEMMPKSLILQEPFGMSMEGARGGHETEVIISVMQDIEKA